VSIAWIVRGAGRRALVALALAPLALPACKGESSEAAGPPGKGGPGGPGRGGRGPARAFPVEVETIGTRDVDYVVSAVGTVEAFEEIQVTARVTGVVEKVQFAEGQTVAAGRPLIEIEPRRYELAVDAARATLAKSRAALAEAEAGLARRETATRDNPGLVPGEEIETWRTRVATARAEANSSKVALDRAELDRRDAFVRAPVAGILQSRTVRTGQYVQPGTVLATLIQRDPLLLRFDVPEREATGLRPGMPVEFGAVTGQEPYRAVIKLVMTAADPSTRMVKVTAEVTDPRKATLRAGSFARIAVGMGTSTGAVVIPQAAVRASEKGFLAYVVADGKAIERVVDIGQHTSDGMLEVKSGLKVGEQLVVRGAEALRQGAPVAVSGSAEHRSPRAGKGAGSAPAGGVPAAQETPTGGASRGKSP
jgi:membrane fusion protein, multidrug efflux system